MNLPPPYTSELNCHAELVLASDQFDDKLLSFNNSKSLSIFRVGKTLKRVQGDWENGRLKRQAFTLAEVLITLVVIGIIAAITVPMIHANYKKQETISKLKKAYSTLSQMVNHSQFDNGKMHEWFDDSKDTGELFNVYFKPYLSHAQYIKDGKDVYGTRMPYKFLRGEMSTYNIYSSHTRTSFFLADGVFIMVSGIMTDSDGKETHYDEPRIFIDINGNKKPNQFGRDVFMAKISKEKGLQPHTNGSFNDCRTSSSSGISCLSKIINDGWEIKEDYPW